MLNKCAIGLAVLMMSMAILVLGGCSPTTAQQAGIHVMFAQKPRIAGDDVYWHGQTIGKIADIQMGHNTIARVTVRLDPRFKQQAGHNWAFYVHRGRMMADRLAVSGDAVMAGDHICGFTSRAALNWFKVKTLLKNRVANAMRRAESLQRKFG